MTDQLMLRNLNETPKMKRKAESPRISERTIQLPVFRRIEILFVFLSIVSYILDTGTDLSLVYFYYIGDDYWYFGLTLGFVIIPSITMTVVSLYWYIIDKSNEGGEPVSMARWILRTVFLLLQLGTIMRYLESLDAGWKSLSKDRRFIMLWAYEDSDATILRLFECFMEAVPQLILQLNIMVREGQAQVEKNLSSMIEDAASVNQTQLKPETEGSSHFLSNDETITVLLQVFSVLTSLVSICWALASYHQAERSAQFDKHNMSIPAMAIYFLWRLGTVSARVLALGLFASFFPLWLAVICGIHWALMTAWFIWQKTDVCGNKCAEIGFDFMVGFVNIFCFFKVKDERTRYKYMAYYTWKFCENSALVGTWLAYADSSLWFYYPAVIGHYVAFFLGLAFMILYYTKFHPSGKIKMPCTS